jgi:hypothetical protein
MSYIKILTTLVILVWCVAMMSWILMNKYTDKRSDFWYKVASICWPLLAVIIVVGVLIDIWVM